MAPFDVATGANLWPRPTRVIAQAEDGPPRGSLRRPHVSRTNPRRLAGALSGIALLLSACGSGGPTDSAAPPPSTSVPPPSTPPEADRAEATDTAEPTDEATETAAPTITIDVVSLSQGPAPQTDVLIGSTLHHDGKATPLDLSDVDGHVQVLGELDGTAYVSTSTQVYRVGEDGALTAVGSPHETYTSWPQLSSTTGHVFFSVSSRTPDSYMLTVMDARTGEVLHVARGLRPARPPLDPRDRRFLAGASDEVGGESYAALSPDRSTGLQLEYADEPSSAPAASVLQQWSTKPRRSLVRRLSFPAFGGPHPAAFADRVGAEMISHVTVESDRSFLLLAYAPRVPRQPDRLFLVRCRHNGTCEQVAEVTGRTVSLAGSDPVFGDTTSSNH